jgi:hypothetical protein
MTRGNAMEGGCPGGSRGLQRRLDVKLVALLFMFIAACTETPVAHEGAGDDTGDDGASIDEGGGTCNCTEIPKPCCCGSPIIIDVDGDGVALTSWQEGVQFNLAPWKGASRRAWTVEGDDDAWLWFDSDGDGKVTDGTELFGEGTPQEAPGPGEERNGFRALDHWDKNADGVIDAKDKIYSRLGLWTDRDHDGKSSADEIRPLSDLVTSISTDYDEPRIPAGNGNELSFSAAVVGAPGTSVGMTAWDVTLASPTGAERAAAGLPDPVPMAAEQVAGLPEALPPKEVTVEAVSTAAGSLLPIVCGFKWTFPTPWKFLESAVGEGTWGIPYTLTCPGTMGSALDLYNKLDGVWRQVDSTDEVLPPDQTSIVSKSCSWPHATTWKAHHLLIIGAQWNPPLVADDSDIAGLFCSAYPPPAQCN